MRILAVSEDNDLGDMYVRLVAAGHEVRLFVRDPDSSDVLDGMIEKATDWRAELDWVTRDGIIVFEGTGWGVEQDALRARGFHVIGGSTFGDKLETDRRFGQATLASVGLETVPAHGFSSYATAADFVRQRGGRFVLKFDGSGIASTRTYVGALDDGRDLCAVLELESRRRAGAATSIVLMEHVRGVEVGVGAFFDGERFVDPPNIDWEHKRFFPGDVGELTGEMGTVVAYRDAERLFDATLRRLGPALREAGHVGYVNLNMIVNERGPIPLELTCRFGIPGFAILHSLFVDGWDVVLTNLAHRTGAPIRTHAGFSVGIVLTVPPFPYRDGYERLSRGTPLIFDGLSTAQQHHVHLGEVKKEGDTLVMAGVVGYAGVVTGLGATIAEARAEALALARKIVIANVRYRDDIGHKLEQTDYARLVGLGWLDRAG